MTKPSVAELVSLSVSFAALCLAVLSTYLQYSTDQQLDSVVLEGDPHGERLVYRIAFVNRGNRSALITDATPVVLRFNADDVNNVIGMKPLEGIRIDQDLPIALDPGKLVVVTFNGPFDFATLYSQSSIASQKGDGCDELDGVQTRIVHIAANINSLDANGEAFEMTTGPITMHAAPSEAACVFVDQKRRGMYRNWYR